MWMGSGKTWEGLFGTGWVDLPRASLIGFFFLACSILTARRPRTWPGTGRLGMPHMVVVVVVSLDSKSITNVVVAARDHTRLCVIVGVC